MRATRSAVAVLMLAAAIAPVSPRATSAATTVRHDGTIEAVDTKTHTIVIREFAAGGRASAVRIHVAPHAPVVRSERSAHAMDVRHEFTTTPIPLSALERSARSPARSARSPARSARSPRALRAVMARAPRGHGARSATPLYRYANTRGPRP